MTFTATKNGTPTQSTMTVVGASVWTDAYRARGVETLTQVPDTLLYLDSTKPADNAAGQPATTMNWGGNGTISLRSLGTHGYLLPRYRNLAGITRVVKLPFTDTFATDGFGNDDGYSSFNFYVDGVSGADGGGLRHGGKVPSNAVGSSVSLRMQTSDTTAMHTLTLCEARRSAYTPPATQYQVTDLATNTTWTLVDLSNQYQTVVQFTFTGTVNLIVKQTVVSSDGNNRANIGCILLD